MNPLFKPVSPLVGWCCLLEVLGAVAIVGCWVQWLHPPHPWQAWGIGQALIVTGLFVGSNWLLLRRRRAGIIGLLACWFWLALMLLPTP